MACYNCKRNDVDIWDVTVYDTGNLFFYCEECILNGTDELMVEVGMIKEKMVEIKNLKAEIELLNKTLCSPYNVATALFNAGLLK